MTHRIRQLAIQGATDTYTSADRYKIQDEINQLCKGIDDIAYHTEFNQMKILVQEASPGLPVTMGTVTDEINPAITATEEYQRIRKNIEEILNDAQEKAYAKLGYRPHNSYIVNVNFNWTSATALAQWSGVWGAQIGTISIDIDKFILNTSGFSIEQVIAHEMCHAMQSAENADYHSTDPDRSWFTEGIAEWSSDNFDARAYADNATPAILNGLRNPAANPAWTGTSGDYIEAALAIEFIKERHGEEKLSGVMNAIEKQASTIENAFINVLKYANFAAFETAFQAWATPYLNNQKYADINPPNRGLAFTKNNDDPIWSDLPDIHIGPNAWETIQVRTPDARCGALDYLGFSDVTTQDSAEDTILTVGKSVDILTTARSDIGSRMNRLEDILDSLRKQEEEQMAAKSQIEDLDFAQEAMTLTRNQILTQSSLAMLTQANAAPQNVLGLI